MSRTARTRDRILAYTSSGSDAKYYQSGGAYIGTDYQASRSRGYEITVDYLSSPRSDNPFDSRKGRAPNCTASGTYNSGGIRHVVTTIPMTTTVLQRFYQANLYASWSKAPISDNTLGAMAVASMNPNKPDLDLPVSIAELRELPQLLKDAGELFLDKGLLSGRGSAKANLAGQFGVLPIIRDLQTLFRFTELVAAREKYLRELSRGWRRYKRTLTTESWKGTQLDLVAFNAPSIGRIDMYMEASRRYWFTAKAKLDFQLDEREIRSLAPNLVLGTDTIHLAHIWNLVPWTWLIDWFTNTGSLIAAYRGGIPWKWSSINVMHRTDFNVSGHVRNLPGSVQPTMAYPQGFTTVLHRDQVSGWSLPEFRLPFLTGAQTSILGSLIVTRLK